MHKQKLNYINHGNELKHDYLHIYNSLLNFDYIKSVTCLI